MDYKVYEMLVTFYTEKFALPGNKWSDVKKENVQIYPFDTKIPAMKETLQ